MIGDTIVAIDGQRMSADFNAIQQNARGTRCIRTHAWSSRSNGQGQRVDIPLTTDRHVETDSFGNQSAIGLIGVRTLLPPSGGKICFRGMSVSSYSNRAAGRPPKLGSDGLLIGSTRHQARFLVGERSIQGTGGGPRSRSRNMRWRKQMSSGVAAFVHCLPSLISPNLAFISQFLRQSPRSTAVQLMF